MRSRHLAVRLVLVAVLTAAPGLFHPGPADAAEGSKLAVLDLERVMRQSAAGKSLQTQIEQIRAANLAKDRQADEDLRAEDQKLNAQRAVLSDESFAQKRKELESRLIAQRKEFEDRRERFQAAVDDAWFRIRAVVVEVTDSIAAEREIDVVVAQRNTVLLSKNLDITDDVLQRLDQKLSEIPLAFDPE